MIIFGAVSLIRLGDTVPSLCRCRVRASRDPESTINANTPSSIYTSGALLSHPNILVLDVDNEQITHIICRIDLDT